MSSPQLIAPDLRLPEVGIGDHHGILAGPKPEREHRPGPVEQRRLTWRSKTRHPRAKGYVILGVEQKYSSHTAKLPIFE